MMPFSGIYGITDDVLCPPEQLLIKVEQALEGGVSILQYRSKTAAPEKQLEVIRGLAELCQRYQVPLLINDDPKLAVSAGAHGVHIGQQDGSIHAARDVLGEQAIIGVTCHANLEYAAEAEAQGASYVAFGRFFPSQTKPGASPAALELLTEAQQRLNIPVVAIGGINPENGAAAIAAGADMLAVIHSLFAGADIKNNAERLVELFGSES